MNQEPKRVLTGEMLLSIKRCLAPDPNPKHASKLFQLNMLGFENFEKRLIKHSLPYIQLDLIHSLFPFLSVLVSILNTKYIVFCDSDQKLIYLPSTRPRQSPDIHFYNNPARSIMDNNKL